MTKKKEKVLKKIMEMWMPTLRTAGAPIALQLQDDAAAKPLQKEHFTVQQGAVMHHSALVMDPREFVFATCFLSDGAVIRSDMARVTIGAYVLVDSGALIRPPLRFAKKKVEALKVAVGSYCHFGCHCVCEALSVGNFVLIEERAIIGKMSVLSVGCWVRADCVVPPSSVLIPFGVYSGNPARLVATTTEDVHPLYVRERILEILQQRCAPLL